MHSIYGGITQWKTRKELEDVASCFKGGTQAREGGSSQQAGKMCEARWRVYQPLASAEHDYIIEAWDEGAGEVGSTDNHPSRLHLSTMSLARAAGAVLRPTQRATTTLIQSRAASSHAHEEHHEEHHEEYHDSNVYEPEGALNNIIVMASLFNQPNIAFSSV